jgi:hypothetical protein
MSQSLRRRALLPLAGAAIMSLALFASVAQATTPAKGYEQSAGCPSKEEVPVVTTCSRSVITGGHFQMGFKDVPIENPIELSGGLEGEGNFAGASPKGGLIPVPQKVPGGVVGLTGLTWLFEFFGSEALTLYAVTELAGVPSSPFVDPLTLPIKVHLVNPGGLIGNSCYVGSVTNPIQLNLTTGTTNPPWPNEPISGVEPEFGFDFETEILMLKNGTYVDNAFAAPGAHGCKLWFGFFPINIDLAVDLQSGLPSPAGTNETVQDFEGEIVEEALVYPSP